MADFVFNAATQTISVGEGGIRIDPGATDLLEVANGILLPDGTLDEPALRFTDDINTGIYSPANETLAIVSDGVEFARFGPSETILNGIIYPNDTGSAGQVMHTDGAGLLYWDDPGAAAVTVTTTDATPTELLRFAVAADSVETSDLVVRGLGPSGGFVARTAAAFRNVAGTVTQIGTTVSETTTDAGAAAWTVGFVIDGTDVVVQVTGAAETIVWTTHVPPEAVSVGGGGLDEATFFMQWVV